MVVIGILIALQINNWNQEQNNRKEEKEILTNLNREFEFNKNELTEIQDDMQSCFKAGQQILELFGKTRSEIQKYNIDSLIYYSLEYFPYNPTQNVLSDLLQSGRLQLLENNRLKDLIYQWTQNLELMNGNYHSLDRWNENQLIVYLTYNISLKDIDLYSTFLNEEKKSLLSTNKLKIFEDIIYENMQENLMYSVKRYIRNLDLLERNIDMILTESNTN